MDYLTLCRRTRLLADVSGNGPASVENQTGVSQRIVEYVREAWLDIQRDPSVIWKWAWTASPQVKTVVAAPSIPLRQFGVKAILPDSVATIYPDAVGASGKTQIAIIGADDMLGIMSGSSSELGVPQLIAEMPNGDIAFHPTPDAAYTINFEAVMTDQVLTANTDTPRMPEEHHMAIVYGALIKYATYDGADDLLRGALNDYQNALVHLRKTQAARRSLVAIIRPE